jgi:hypothetical protein
MTAFVLTLLLPAVREPDQAANVGEKTVRNDALSCQMVRRPGHSARGRHAAGLLDALVRPLVRRPDQERMEGARR